MTFRRLLMFLDASAIVAILVEESDAASLAKRSNSRRDACTSPIALYEAVAGSHASLVSRSVRQRRCLDRFLDRARAADSAITAEIGRGALLAFERFGRGRHPAALNMGDCFAYACARHLDIPLLFKGETSLDRHYDRLMPRRRGMAVFFTSDTHFGHGGALGLYRRPFASVAAMNEALVERWNETVGPEDTVWHLGDFAIRQRPTVVADLSPVSTAASTLSPATTILRQRASSRAGRASNPISRSRSTAFRWSSAITRFGAGATWARVGSICTAIPTAG